MSCYRNLPEGQIVHFPKPQTERQSIMNQKLIAEVVSDLTELSPLSAKPSEDQANTLETPFYIVPAPPAPGKTAWSIAPL